MIIGSDKIISFDVNRPSTITFNFEVEGAESNQLQFKFIIQCDEAELGFEGYIYDGVIQIDVPPLYKVLPKGVSGRYNAYLQVVADKEFYQSPWSDIVEIYSNPLINADPEIETQEFNEGKVIHNPPNIAEIKDQIIKMLMTEIDVKVEEKLADLQDDSKSKVERVKVDILRELVAKI
jgi:hypothetical protein